MSQPPSGQYPHGSSGEPDRPGQPTPGQGPWSAPQPPGQPPGGDQPGQYGQFGPSQQPISYGPPGQQSSYGQPGQYGQPGAYGQPGQYGQPGAYGQSGQGSGEWSSNSSTGRFACALIDGRTWLYWTDRVALTEGILVGPGSTQADLGALYDWWTTNSDYVL